ncbi:MAG: MarR family transcriptional regulator [Actinomycetales bacterium]|nr:MarR family transcriptional regulator [Actinomycetales bacterium]
MSDHSSTSGSADPLLPHAAFVREWRQTPTLVALRELIDLSGQVAPTIARRADLGHSELRALELLVRVPHGPSELARELGVTSAAASGIVDRLENRGHVRRTPHAMDGRRTHVVLTDSGREDVLGYLIPMFAALQRMDDSFSEAERAVVERYLRAAMEAIRTVL